MTAADSMTMLRCHPGHRATKRWHIDPSTGELLCDGYDAGYRFAVRQHPVDGIESVGVVIDETRRDPRSFIIMRWMSASSIQSPSICRRS